MEKDGLNPFKAAYYLTSLTSHGMENEGCVFLIEKLMKILLIILL